MDEESNSDEINGTENDDSQNDSESKLSTDFAEMIDSSFSASDHDVWKANLIDDDDVPYLHCSDEDENNGVYYKGSNGEDERNNDFGAVQDETSPLHTASPQRRYPLRYSRGTKPD